MTMKKRAKVTTSDGPSQSDKFKQAAHEHGAEEDEARWDERLQKVVKPKPPKEA